MTKSARGAAERELSRLSGRALSVQPRSPVFGVAAFLGRGRNTASARLSGRGQCE